MKFFRYLFILTIMFILPGFVLAEETDTTFDHIDINKSVSLKYTVSGSDKIYTKTLDSLTGINLYMVDKDNSDIKTPISMSDVTDNNDTYRINGNFNKLYDGTDTFIKYLVEYTFTDSDIFTSVGSNTNKSITYSKEYSYDESSDDGILINLQEATSIESISPMLTIKKQLEPNTPPGTFKFNIKSANGNLLRTVDIVIPDGSNSKELFFETININTSYLIEEVPDSKNIYELVSKTSNKEDPTIEHDDNTIAVRTNSAEEGILVTFTNRSAVDHSKEAHPNGDGTYQLSLDVTGENEKNPANKANVVVILDISGSMDNETGNTVSQMYNAVAPGGTGLFGIVNGQYVSLTRHGNSSSNYYYTYRSGWNDVTYNGVLYESTTRETRMIAARNAIKSLSQSLLANNTTENPDVVKMALVTFSTTASIAIQPTTFYSTIETTVNQTYATGGTNWEDALDVASSINFGADRDATTYYIFVSDGNPTYRNTPDNAEYLPITDNVGWYYTDGWGRIQMTYNDTGGYYYYEHYRSDKRSDRTVYGLGNDKQRNDNNQINYNYSPTSMQRCYDNAKDDAKDAVDDGVVLYTIGAYGDASRMQSLTNYAYTGSDTPTPEGTYYYNASNTTALNQAFRDILAEIERSGIGSVTISDGTTQSITTSAGVSNLLTVDESSYEYWLTFDLSSDNKIKVNDTVVTVTENNGIYTLSWTEGETPKSLTLPAGSYKKGNTFVYKWTGSNDFYKVAPPEAKLENGAVSWELSKEKVGLLLNDVKYSVTFNVWPSQYTYDLISDFENGIKDYNSSEFDEIRDYLIYDEASNSFSLKTNTTATLTYDDSRDEVGSRETYFVNPSPVATGVSEVSLEKVWKNALDSRDADEIELYLTVDGEDYGEKDEFGNPLPYVLKKTDDPKTNWKKDIFISTGLISLDRTTGTAIVREVGHEYGFREKPSDAYYWDLVVAIRRPMVINKANGELETVMLIKVDKSDIDKLTTDQIAILNTKNYLIVNGNEYFKICNEDDKDCNVCDEDGKDCHVYRRATTAESNTISATNYRRSNLNVTKEVEGDYDPDTLFEFDLQVTDANGHDVWFSIWNGTGYVINDANHNYVTGATAEILVESDTIHNIVYDPTTGKVTYIENGEEKEITYIGEDSNGNPFTGFYFFRSGNTITVLMKAGWNLRFTNLPNGSTYIFDEVLDSEKYNFVKVKINEYRKATTGDPGVNRDTYNSTISTLVTSEIKEYNLSYTVTYTNKAVKADPVTATKIWQGDNEDVRPTSIKLNLLADGKLKDSIIITGSSSTWNHTWENLAKFNAAGREIVYTVTEEAVTEGDLAHYLAVLNGLTITNYYNLRDITVTKNWRENAKQAAVVVQLTSNRDYSDSQTLNSGNWTHTWTDLDKYYLDNNTLKEIIYTVSEISVNDIALVNGIVYDYDSYIHSTIGKWTLVSITDNGIVGSTGVVTVTNDYKKYDTSLSFKKMSFKDFYDNKTNGLNGAVFRLYKYVGEGISSNDPITNLSDPGNDWIYIGEAMSNSNGLMVFDAIYKDDELYLDGLYEGEYRLVEIQSPVGYVKVDGQWRLFIDLNKNTDVVALRSFSDYDDEHPVSVGKTTALSFDDDDNIVVLNEDVPELPTTGGIGIPHNNKYGLLLMLLSIGIWLFNIINQRRQIENI